jgi:hypothetical protein
MTYTITMPIHTCHMCGERHWRHVAVLSAVEYYCRECAPLAMLTVQRLKMDADAKNWKAGVVMFWQVFDPVRA